MTIKSDDMESRKKAYSAIIRHGEIPQPSIPDAFKLLTKQLQGLCLKIDVITDSRIIDMDDFVATKLDFTIADPNAGAKKIGESESSSFGESEID
jgi:DNA-directed RNA polymerase subunit beta